MSAVSPRPACLFLTQKRKINFGSMWCPLSFHPWSTAQNREWVYKIFQNFPGHASCLGGFLLSRRNTVKNKEKQHLSGRIKTSYACSSLSMGTDKTYPWFYWSANKKGKNSVHEKCAEESTEEEGTGPRPTHSTLGRKEMRRGAGAASCSLICLPSQTSLQAALPAQRNTRAHTLPRRRPPSVLLKHSEALGMRKWHFHWGKKWLGMAESGSLRVRPLSEQTQIPSPVSVAHKAMHVLMSWMDLVFFF